MTDSRRACGLCGKTLRDEEAVTLWCGRHFWPRPEDGAVRWREEYVTVLCHRCAEQRWPPLQDAVKGLAWSLPPEERR